MLTLATLWHLLGKLKTGVGFGWWVSLVVLQDAFKNMLKAFCINGSTSVFFFDVFLQPAFIYDPRMTMGNARQLARKNLGKKHLVYFFECHDAPFSVLASTKITK